MINNTARHANRYLARNFKLSLIKRSSSVVFTTYICENSCTSLWNKMGYSTDLHGDQLFERLGQAYKLWLKTYHIGCHPRDSTSVFHLLQVSRYFCSYTWNTFTAAMRTIFLFAIFSFFNFPKIHFEMFDIKSNTCYKIVIRMSFSNLHVIVKTKTFQSKQILTKSDYIQPRH